MAAHQAPPSLGFSRQNTGVGFHFLLQCMEVKSENEVAQSCPTLSYPMDCSLPGSSAHGIFQARVLEWGAIALQLLVTTEEPIIPSIERDQKLWEDKINPQVWDQGIPGQAHQAEPVIIVLRDPTQFPNWKQYPLKREAREGLQPLINKVLACGLLVPTSSPCNIPILSVKKKDGTW